MQTSSRKACQRNLSSSFLLPTTPDHHTSSFKLAFILAGTKTLMVFYTPLPGRFPSLTHGSAIAWMSPSNNQHYFLGNFSNLQNLRKNSPKLMQPKQAAAQCQQSISLLRFILPRVTNI